MARTPLFGNCCICNEHCKLSFEHIPPKKAFNNTFVSNREYIRRLKEYHPDYENLPKRDDMQGGFGRYSLCETCNNNTGGWYAPAFIEWSRQGWLNLNIYPGYTLKRPFRIKPLEVIKQIVAMFASISGATLFNSKPELRKFVLDKNCKLLPDGIRILAYYNPSTSIRSVGVSAMMNIDTKNITVLSEFSFYPFGYVLLLDGKTPDSRQVDITFMASSSYGDYRELTLPLPSLQVATAIPGDYRSVEQVT